MTFNLVVFVSAISLTCYCNSHDDKNFCHLDRYGVSICNTTNRDKSRCYHSIEITGNTTISTMGCFSHVNGSGTVLFHCNFEPSKQGKTVTYIRCCDSNYCNLKAPTYPIPTFTPGFTSTTKGRYILIYKYFYV